MSDRESDADFVAEVSRRISGLDEGALRERVIAYAGALEPEQRVAFLGIFTAVDAPPVVVEQIDVDARRAEFRKAPGVGSLLVLLEAAGSDPAVVRRLVEREIRENGWGLEDLMPGDEANLPDAALLARMELLAGRYGDAIERFLDEDPATWEEPGRAGYAVVSFLLLAGSGLNCLPRGTAMADLWFEMDRESADLDGVRSCSARLLDQLGRWKVSAMSRQRFLGLAHQAVEERIETLVERGDPGPAALSLVAQAEAYFLAGEMGESRRLLDPVLDGGEGGPAFASAVRDLVDDSPILTVEN